MPNPVTVVVALAASAGMVAANPGRASAVRFVMRRSPDPHRVHARSQHLLSTRVRQDGAPAWATRVADLMAMAPGAVTIVDVRSASG